MRRQQDEVRAVLARDGLVARRDHPELVWSMDWLLRTGELRQVLPGVYTGAGVADTFQLRVAALARWAPDAVLVRGAAARLTFWPSHRFELVECALRRRGAHPGFHFSRRSVPGSLVDVRQGLRVTSPALTALDLSDHGTDAIDHVLRTRSATLAGLWEALCLTPGRRGNQQRLAHLVDSRDEPWSAAERRAHRLLPDAASGAGPPTCPWCRQAACSTSTSLFRRARVSVEIDGRLHETDPDVFESDRWRQNALVLDGWVVLRFTWVMLVEHPEVVLTTIGEALAAAGHRPRP